MFCSDLKPDNVVVGLAARDAGKLFIVDFGFAEAFKTRGVHVERRSSGQLIGTRQSLALCTPTPSMHPCSLAARSLYLLLSPLSQKCSCLEQHLKVSSLLEGSKSLALHSDPLVEGVTN